MDRFVSVASRPSRARIDSYRSLDPLSSPQILQPLKFGFEVRTIDLRIGRSQFVLDWAERRPTRIDPRPDYLKKGVEAILVIVLHTLDGVIESGFA